jgi:hypothetical protein
MTFNTPFDSVVLYIRICIDFGRLDSDPDLLSEYGTGSVPGGKNYPTKYENEDIDCFEVFIFSFEGLRRLL